MAFPEVGLKLTFVGDLRLAVKDKEQWLLIAVRSELPRVGSVVFLGSVVGLSEFCWQSVSRLMFNWTLALANNKRIVVGKEDAGLPDQPLFALHISVFPVFSLA